MVVVGGGMFLMSEVPLKLTNPAGHLWRDEWTALSGPHSLPSAAAPLSSTPQPVQARFLPCLEPYSVQGYLACRKCTPLGPYRRLMPRVLGGSQGGGRFPMIEVPLCGACRTLAHLSHAEAGPACRSLNGTSLIRNPPPLGPYSRPMPSALRIGQGPAEVPR